MLSLFRHSYIGLQVTLSLLVSAQLGSTASQPLTIPLPLMVLVAISVQPAITAHWAVFKALTVQWARSAPEWD